MSLLLRRGSGPAGGAPRPSNASSGSVATYEPTVSEFKLLSGGASLANHIMRITTASHDLPNLVAPIRIFRQVPDDPSAPGAAAGVNGAPPAAAEKLDPSKVVPFESKAGGRPQPFKKKSRQLLLRRVTGRRGSAGAREAARPGPLSMGHPRL
ncbi:hypothetical protein HK405_012789 [Cladochytrium tenue]|nr:hypothetical protein HK405_012789 [Cladochytrium tenue]